MDILLRYSVPRVEAAAFTQITPALVRYRVNGLSIGPDGAIQHTTFGFGESVTPGGRRTVFESPSRCFSAAARREP